MPEAIRLEANQLYRACDSAALGFRDTSELEPLTGALGQAEAMAAIEFGLGIDAPGYNLFVVGLPGSGRTSFVLELIKARAAEGEDPADWCYVQNFRDPRSPRAISLPTGRAAEFKADVERCTADLRRLIPEVLQSDDVVSRRTDLVQGPERSATAELDKLRREIVEDEHVALVGGPDSFSVAPARGGEAIERDAYLGLPEEHRARIDERLREANTRVFAVQRRIRELQREARERVTELNRQVVEQTVADLVAPLKEKYDGIDSVPDQLDQMAADVVDNFEVFATSGEGEGGPMSFLPGAGREDFFRRYHVNVLVTREPGAGAPVVEERNPNLANLTGRMERRMEFGAMVTDFTRIAAGAMHRAAGGYLVLEAAEVLTRPLVWPALKRTLRTCRLQPAEMSAELGLFVTESLEPEPIPIDVKIVLIGDAAMLHVLQMVDPDFRELFKVKSDFRPRMDRDDEAERGYARFVARRCERESLPDFGADAVAAVIEESSRMAGDQRKLTGRFGEVADLIRESAHWAGREKRSRVGADDVARAIAEREIRNNRPHREILELIERGVLAFEPRGERVGQLYGIGLSAIGSVVVGRPIGLMASAFMGTSGVIHIEREAKLSGRIHSKGFLVLSGYLGWRFARAQPLILSASLSFEQMYEEVEGDSASVAELYTLLSAIAEIPLRQGIAVTGAISPKGAVLPVGGVTEKVEGHFAACERVGLTGEQGVILPRRNMDNLVVRREVRDAVTAGRFHVWAIDRVEDGWPVLAGMEAGEELPDGGYTEGSVHAAVLHRLRSWAVKWARIGGRVAPGAEALEDDDGAGIDDGDDEDDGETTG